jgi:hypothetical protein
MGFIRSTSYVHLAYLFEHYIIKETRPTLRECLQPDLDEEKTKRALPKVWSLGKLPLFSSRQETGEGPRA